MNRGIAGYPALAGARGVTFLGAATVTSGSADTKTAWVEVAVTASSYDGLAVNLSVAFAEALVDISAGGVGGERMIAENLHTSGLTGTGPAHDTRAYHLPGIGAGERLWMRAQISVGAVTIQARVFGLVGSYPGLLGLRCMETYGAQTSDSGGQNIDPGGSANNIGAWQTLGTTTKHVRLLQLSIGQRDNAARSNTTFLLYIGIGTANPLLVDPPAESPNGSVIVNRLRLRAHTSGDFVTPSFFGPFPVDIPPGTAIRATAECTITDATDRLFDLIAYGLAA